MSGHHRVASKQQKFQSMTVMTCIRPQQSFEQENALVLIAILRAHRHPKALPFIMLQLDGSLIATSACAGKIV